MKAGDVVAERYELKELVGTGGMSSVYRARDRELERTVALKVLHERLVSEQDIVDRFSREARLVAQLSHHNIVAVIDRGEHAGSPFIVFEFIDGVNLKQLVAADGPLPVERTLELGIEIARALAFAHDQGFVHRDVKPQNVLLTSKGVPKVTDFGIARSIEAREGETQTGTVLGTCDYISPEQAQGRRVDELSDVYSLGIVLYEMLTGEVPFSGYNFVAVAMQHINAPPPPVTLLRPEVPRRVEAAIDRALAKEPSERFYSMADFATELEGCLAEVRAGGDDAMATGILPALGGRRKARSAGAEPRQRESKRRPSKRRRRKDRRAKERSSEDRRAASGRSRGWLGFRLRRRWALLLAVVVAAAIAVGVVLSLQSGGGPSLLGGGGKAIPLKAATAYDPDGDHHENDQFVSRATDGSLATFWATEAYRYPAGGLGKAGVGIVFDAGSTVKGRSITIDSTTPGFTAEIQAGDSPSGPFTADSSSQKAHSKTTFHLSGASARYYVIWITNRGTAQSVRINEVTGTA